MIYLNCGRKQYAKQGWQRPLSRRMIRVCDATASTAILLCVGRLLPGNRLVGVLIAIAVLMGGFACAPRGAAWAWW